MPWYPPMTIGHVSNMIPLNEERGRGVNWHGMSVMLYGTFFCEYPTRNNVWGRDY